MENGNDKNTFFRFEDLRIYHKALNYAKWVSNTTAATDNSDSSVILDRFNNSAHNIVLNIAEGSARNKSQFIYYLKMAKSAVRQCLVFTSILHKVEMIDDQAEDESRNQLMEMTKMIGALISSLQRTNNKRDDDSYDHHDDMPDD